MYISLILGITLEKDENCICHGAIFAMYWNCDSHLPSKVTLRVNGLFVTISEVDLISMV